MKRIQHAEDWRHSRSATGKDRLITERADCKQKPRLAASGISSHAEIWKFVEAIIDPAKQHIIARDLLKERAYVHIAVKKRADLFDQLFFAAVLFRLGRK